MAGDLLRANAPESAPTGGKTLSPSFAFRRTAAAERIADEAFHSRAGLPAGWCSVRAAAGAVGIMRKEGSVTFDLTMPPEQARALSAELIEAADAAEPQPEGAAALLADLRQELRTFDAIAAKLVQEAPDADTAAERLRSAAGCLAKYIAKWGAAPDAGDLAANGSDTTGQEG